MGLSSSLMRAARNLIICILLWTQSLLTTAFNPPATFTENLRLRRHPGAALLSQMNVVNGDTPTHVQPPNPVTKVPADIISTLDLEPLMAHVASYACTKRGKEAILDVVSTPSPSALRKSTLFGNKQQLLQRRDWYDTNRLSWMKHDGTLTPPISIAQSAEEAMHEYDLVREAMKVLRSQTSTGFAIPLPPTFQLFDGVSTSIDSDDDEWIDLCLGPLPPGMDVYQEIDLETVLKAEQVVKLLLDTYKWAMGDMIRDNAPGLVDVVRQMEHHDGEAGSRGMQSLSELYQTLRGTVEIVRAGPSLSDPDNRFSFQFRLSDNGRFPELDKLREKEERILTKKTDNGQQLAIVRNEMAILESQITRTLITAMIRAAKDVQRGMNALARLDVVFAKASFGCDWDGTIPEMGTEGQVHVEQFVHPVLALESRVVKGDGDGNVAAAVPVDLVLPGVGGYQSLIISGPNGGGKTLALKSFGLVSMMTKLGLPIPVASKRSGRLVVDYFADILVEVGDAQSISKHESTLMARLNALAALIQDTSSSNSDAKLVLLDEIGSGTDPVAGSAIFQALLEHLISTSPGCKIVSTTHSPQLKALSINDSRFETASVLMSGDKVPIYKLSYGTVGESFALEAARRARPPLPDGVIRRAAELMNGGDDNAVDSLKLYLSALEEQQRKAKELIKETEEQKQDMLSKLEVSNIQLSRLESRLESIFNTLKNDGSKDTFELVGDSLEELRLLRRKVKTESELLAEKGLRRVPDSYLFYDGETVVIIADGEWKGYDAVVKQTSADGQLVTVSPVLDLFSIDEDESLETLTLSRRGIAIFDYPDSWGFSGDNDSYATTNKQSKSNNVLSVLSTLDTGKKSYASSSNAKAKDGASNYTSARERKAASAAAKKAAKKSKSKR